MSTDWNSPPRFGFEASPSRAGKWLKPAIIGVVVLMALVLFAIFAARRKANAPSDWPPAPPTAAELVPEGPGAAMFPVELRYSDGKSQLKRSIAVKSDGTQTLVALIELVGIQGLEQAVALIDDKQGTRRVPLVGYAVDTSRGRVSQLYNEADDPYGPKYRLIFTGPKDRLPAPLAALPTTTPAHGEKLRFTGCDVAQFGDREAYSRWIDEAETVQTKDRGAYFTLRSGRRGIGILQTERGELAAIVDSQTLEPLGKQSTIVQRATHYDPRVMPTLPNNVGYFADRRKGERRVRILAQVFDPEKKVAEARLWGLMRKDDAWQPDHDAMGRPRKRPFTLSNNRWSDRPVEGFEMRLTEVELLERRPHLIDAELWPHVRFWSGEYEVDQGTSTEFLLVVGDAAGKLTTVGEPKVVGVFELPPAAGSTPR